MKLKSLHQQLRCPECRRSQNVRETQRLMNFTFGDIIFFCRCRQKLGEIRFSEWNQLQRESLEKPPASKESKARPSLPRNRERPKGRGQDRNRKRR
ncbi:MAG: hypothetical protein HQM15_04045 [Deltaproteobacteria bacterium]|nr:hypothetical protein [Deltaproteobacteria bacterium]